ncbi:MAG: hypothetical protein OEM91_08865 [Hyphomicrobiales bacterium]|nr:hypothetical protein [Hyphomicrobiales bacterium]
MTCTQASASEILIAGTGPVGLIAAMALRRRYRLGCTVVAHAQ